MFEKLHMKPLSLRAALILVAATVTGAVASADAVGTVEINATDTMQYSIQRIEASPGEKVRVVLTVVSKMSKSSMAHNFVLLASGVDPAGIAVEALVARGNGYLPTRQPERILASTRLVGGGETATVVFTAPKEPGTYVYICTFPGHFNNGMRGELIVK